MELIFALKTRMINLKKNFPSANKDDIACSICKVQVECQEHLMQCVELKKSINIPADVKYEDLYKTTDKQLKLVKVYKQLLRKRELILNEK